MSGGYEPDAARHASAAPRRDSNRATDNATPEATAHPNASGHVVDGDAGFAGGSSPRARRHTMTINARVAVPAAIPARPPTTRQASSCRLTSEGVPECGGLEPRLAHCFAM